MEPGSAVVVETADRHLFRGRLVEVRVDKTGREIAVIRFETGWLTSYPLSMVRIDPTAAESDAPSPL